MTSNNVKKIVQNNIFLNPCMLSKNTDEMVNSCIQKMYKQMPQRFRNELRRTKSASQRPENKAPLRTLKTQEIDQQESTKIRPQVHVIKKTVRPKVNSNQLLELLSSKPNHYAGKASKPTYKIYPGRRYGSSVSSSHSSIFRRYDEKRQRMQAWPPQLFQMVRSLHCGEFESSFTKNLMPARNQQPKGNLGSLPDAMRVSSSIQNELMCIDDAVKNRISVSDNVTRKKPKRAKQEKSVLEAGENLSPSLNNNMPSPMSHKFKQAHTKNIKKLSPENNSVDRYDIGPLMHISEKVQKREEHRRSRMKKLGLTRDSTRSTTPEIQQENAETQNTEETENNDDCCYTKSAPLYAHIEARKKSEIGMLNKRNISHFPVVNNIYETHNDERMSQSSLPITENDKNFQNDKRDGNHKTSGPMKDSETSLGSISDQEESSRLIGPLAMAASQTNAGGNVTPWGDFRYNRANFFPPSKY